MRSEEEEEEGRALDLFGLCGEMCPILFEIELALPYLIARHQLVGYAKLDLLQVSCSISAKWFVDQSTKFSISVSIFIFATTALSLLLHHMN